MKNQQQQQQQRTTVQSNKQTKCLSKSSRNKEANRRDAMTSRNKTEPMMTTAEESLVLRAPIVVVMGHVDTGKTNLLDKIRRTDVQGEEAGGITQQIGATFIESKTLLQQIDKLHKRSQTTLNLPGMLLMDTPGHTAFRNLRCRGSSLCDVAVLVVDLMHGLEQQTLESLTLLQNRRVPFVVVLNKVDRCFGWKPAANDIPIRRALKAQRDHTVSEFRGRVMDTKVQLQEQGLNSDLYWEMSQEDWTDPEFVPLIPTSALTGEGIKDILFLLCQVAQQKLVDRLTWSSQLECSVMEVKAMDGLGVTVDALLVNGHLQEGDRAVFCTLNGPVVTEIRGLLTPPPNRDTRITNKSGSYIHHKQVKGALGVKIIGSNLDNVLAGTPVMVVGPNDKEDNVKAAVMADLLSNRKDNLATDKQGVMVQASTLGALEALLQYLRVECNPPVPVSAAGIGAISKRDVKQIATMMLKTGKPEYATILAFDVDVDSEETRQHAEALGVSILTAPVIYHLSDQYTRFRGKLEQERREAAAGVAVFPCILKIIPKYIINRKDPILVGVKVMEGIVKVGTPLCIPSLDGLHVGRVLSIEKNGQDQETARKGAQVAVKIVNQHHPTMTYGRQFDANHLLVSTISRESIDALKEHFRDELQKEDWLLVKKLKKVYSII